MYANQRPKRTLAVLALTGVIALGSAGCGSHPSQDTASAGTAVTDSAVAFPGADLAKPATIYATAAANLHNVPAVRIQTTGATGVDVPDDLVIDRGGVYVKSREFGQPYEAIVIGHKAGYLRAAAAFWQAAGLDRGHAARLADLWVRDDTIAAQSDTRTTYLDALSTKLKRTLTAASAKATLTSVNGQSAIEATSRHGDVIFAGKPLLPTQLRSTTAGVTTMVTFTYAGLTPVTAPEGAVALKSVLP